MECGQRRSLDALRAAFRVAAAVTTQYVTRYARHYGVAIEMLTSLRAVVDAECERLCGLAAEGYASAETGTPGQAARRREPVIDCAEHRTTLMLFADDLLIDNLIERRLAPLATLTERQQDRMLITFSTGSRRAATRARSRNGSTSIRKLSAIG